MSGGGDDGERPRRSWSEIDRLRDQPRARRDDAAARGSGDALRGRAAAQQYLRKVERGLFGKKGGEPERLAAAVRDALGTPALADACRAYLDALGPPADPALLSAFLDAPDRALQLAALEAIAERAAAGRLALGAGLRAQLRTLAAGSDDALAEAADAALAAG
jgi:hypothetical protein